MEDLPLATEVMCDSDVQRFDVTSIECVPLDMIAERPVWVQKRLDRIREWSDIETINSLPINKNNSNRFDEVASHSLPYLTRDVSLDKNCNIIFDKYDIADGIHRVARARELGASCILSRATNIVKIKR